MGFKLLKMLASLGKNATLLIYPNVFWPYNLTDSMLERITQRLSRYEVEIIVKDDISGIDAQDNAFRVTTRKGIEKTVDMVFFFNGLSPNIEFVKGSGIDIDHGVMVNEYLRTNKDRIYACGSCAQIYNPVIKSHTASIEPGSASVNQF